MPSLSREQAGLREAALRLLARREHSRVELQLKLRVRGYALAHIDAVLIALEREGWLSDARYAEEYVQARRQRGFGPLRIRAELKEKGVEEAVISACLHPEDEDWLVRLRQLWAKRQSEGRDRLRQLRFLQARGFTHRQIQTVVGYGHDE